MEKVEHGKEAENGQRETEDGPREIRRELKESERLWKRLNARRRQRMGKIRREFESNLEGN